MHGTDIQNPFENMLRKWTAEPDVDKTVKTLFRIVKFVFPVGGDEKTLFRSDVI